MIYSLRRGSTTPTTDDLNLYELGWETTNKRLYIRDNGTIRRLDTKVTLNAGVSNDPSFYAPTAVTANRVLKTKASWTLGQDPFEYISIDGTVTVDSTNLITSGAVSSAITTLQSAINESLNNKVNKDGDTMTGELSVPTLRIGNQQISWNLVDGTFDMTLLNGVTLQSGQEIHFYGKAQSAISNRQAIQFAGVEGDHILIKPAVASEINANPSLFIGVATQAIASGEFGYVTWFGNVNNVFTLDLGGVGSIIWYDSGSATPGSLTTTKPTAPNAKIQVAAVVRAATGGAENGKILTRVSIGSELGGTDSNVQFTSLTGGQLIGYNGSNSRWENINGLHWDFANSRLGIGTMSPSNKLHIGQDFGLSIGGNWYASQFAVRGTTNTNEGLFLGFDTTNNIGFLQSGEVGVGYRTLAINPNGGNVGIGTTSPSEKLDVNGNAKATKFIGALNETNANIGTSIWTGTQAQYDAIGTKDNTTLYFII